MNQQSTIRIIHNPVLSIIKSQMESANMSDTIITKHPHKGKDGLNISRTKYNVVRRAILDCLRRHGEIAFKDLTEDVRRRLQGSFYGSIPWYVTTVKLDLEAREVIERIPHRRPQQLRLVQR